MRRAVVMLALIALPGAHALAQSAPPGDEPDLRTRSRMSEFGPYRSRMRVLRDSADLATPADPAALLESMEGNDYGRALLLRRLAHDAVGASDVDGAIAQLEEALALNALAGPAQQQMALNLARLYASAGRHEDTVALLKPMLDESPDIDPNARFAYGLALVETGDPAEGARQLRLAARTRDPVPEDWLRALVFASYQSGDYAAAASDLERLVASYPGNRDYWLQLAGTLRAADRPLRAAAVLETAATRQLLTLPAHWLNLVNAYLAAGLPLDAAELLQGLLARETVEPTTEHWTLLGQARLAARQPAEAIPPLVEAARTARDRTAWLAVARLQLAERQWDQAVASLERARRGNRLGPRNGEALLMLGEAQYRAGDTRQARKAFALAAEEGVVYRAAQAWLDYLDGRAADGR
ncbi:MAG: tetratricopeptide repeat protein [Pseudomonadota bacterium]